MTEARPIESIGEESASVQDLLLDVLALPPQESAVVVLPPSEEGDDEEDQVDVSWKKGCIFLMEALREIAGGEVADQVQGTRRLMSARKANRHAKASLVTFWEAMEIAGQ